MDIYREALIDHYQNPRNYGEIVDADVIIKEENISCGDSIQLFITVKNHKISDIKFQGEGCAIAIASASILTEHVKGMSLEEANAMTFEDLEKLMGVTLTMSRIKCANLSLEGLKKVTKKFDRTK